MTDYKNYFSGIKYTVNDSTHLATLKREWGERLNKYKENQTKRDKTLSFMTQYVKEVESGYMTSMNVVIDVAHVLFQYRDFIKEIGDFLKAIEISMDNSIVKPEQLMLLQNLTTSQLGRIETFFTNEYNKLVQLFGERGENSEQLRELQSRYNTVKSAANSYRNAFTGGRYIKSNVKIPKLAFQQKRQVKQPQKPKAKSGAVKRKPRATPQKAGCGCGLKKPLQTV